VASGMQRARAEQQRSGGGGDCYPVGSEHVVRKKGDETSF
jgi:hypothetical protein